MQFRDELLHEKGRRTEDCYTKEKHGIIQHDSPGFDYFGIFVGKIFDL